MLDFGATVGTASFLQRQLILGSLSESSRSRNEKEHPGGRSGSRVRFTKILFENVLQHGR